MHRRFVMSSIHQLLSSRYLTFLRHFSWRMTNRSNIWIGCRCFQPTYQLLIGLAERICSGIRTFLIRYSAEKQLTGCVGQSYNKNIIRNQNRALNINTFIRVEHGGWLVHPSLYFRRRSTHYAVKNIYEWYMNEDMPIYLHNLSMTTVNLKCTELKLRLLRLFQDGRRHLQGRGRHPGEGAVWGGQPSRGQQEDIEDIDIHLRSNWPRDHLKFHRDLTNVIVCW